MEYLAYSLKCTYIGQTGRILNIRYKEQIHAIRNSSSTGYSDHILNTRNTYGTMSDTMDIISRGQKGRYLDTLETYHIYRIGKVNLHMNEIHGHIQSHIQGIIRALRQIAAHTPKSCYKNRVSSTERSQYQRTQTT